MDDKGEETISEALALLARRDRGELGGFVTFTQRAEQDVEPWELAEAEERIGVLLLGIGNDEAHRREALAVVGPEEGLRILRLVLRPYQPIRFGDFRRYPRIERADSGIVWSLDQIVLGETGLWIDTTVLRWARVEPAVGVALAGLRWELLKHWNQWWQGFSQVRDDLDTSYTRVLNCVEPTAPLAVDFDGAEAGLLDPAVNCLHIMATQQLREYWRPGVPNTARMLYLDGDLEIEAVCLLPDAPWTMPRHWSLGPVHYGIGPIW